MSQDLHFPSTLFHPVGDFSFFFEGIQTQVVEGRDMVGSHSVHPRCPAVRDSEMEQPWEEGRVHSTNPLWLYTDSASTFMAGSIV